MNIVRPTRTGAEVIASWPHTDRPACRYCGQDEAAPDGTYLAPAYDRGDPGIDPRSTAFRTCATWCRGTGVDPYPHDPTAVR